LLDFSLYPAAICSQKAWIYCVNIVNSFSSQDGSNGAPITVACDVTLVASSLSEPALTLVAFGDWLLSDDPVDVVLCNVAASPQCIQQARQKNSNVYLIALVESLSGVRTEQLLKDGACDLITQSELDSGRLQLMLRQRFGCSSDKQIFAEQQKSLELRNKLMSALSDVSMRLMERKRVDELMDHIALQAVSLADTDSAFVCLLHESGNYVEIVGAVGRFVEHKGFKQRIGLDVAGLAWELEELVLFDAQANDPEFEALWGNIQRRCAVPFFIDGNFSGLICVALDSVDAGIENCLDVLKLFTRTASIAIANLILINEQKAELTRHAAISELTESIYSASSLRELVDGVCKSLLSVFHSKHVSVCQYGLDKKFSLLTEWQNDRAGIRRANFVNVKLMSDSTSQWCVDNKRGVLVRNGENDARDSEAVQRIKKVLGIGCSITLPLIQDGVVWGALTLGKGIEQRDFSDVELSLLDILTGQLASSVQRQNLLDKIHFQAFHDSLTQLPNRLRFENVLSEIVCEKNEKTDRFALLFLDLDGFKAVNDNQGHRVGDELLKQVSKRLAGSLQEKDLLARMGGDEFAVLLRGVKSRESALSIASRLSGAIGKKFIVDKYNLKIGVSIGVSFYPDNGETVDDLLRNADFAMYEAKAEGNSSVKSFNLSMAEQYRDRVALESDLLNAIENQQFELHYQPKVDIVNGVVSGAEALLRWRHPAHGYVSPADFVPLAEEAGYITEIGKWVLNEAVRQNALWVNQNAFNLSMAVNISAPQFVLEDFASGVIAILSEHKMSPELLELEVTESVVMNSLSKVVATLDGLREQGVSIAIDDFGTGYSSLAYLETLPLDCMKIDKVFVDKLVTGSEKNSLVNTILTMARTFGLRTVAEGIETEDQLQKLKSLGCECVQGFYFSKPVPASDIPAAIAEIESRFNASHINQSRFTENRKAG